MTREEAIARLEANSGAFVFKETNEALDMAIEALSVPVVDITQRDLCADISCTDCPFMKDTCKLMDYVTYADRPHGEWINREKCQVDEDAYEVATCSECGAEITIEYPHDSYCPNCGADMRKENKQL